MIKITLILICFMLIDSIKVLREPNAPPYKYHHTKDGFRNENIAIRQPGFDVMFPFIVKKLFGNFDRKKYDIARVENTGEIYSKHTKGATITWVGHSTLLIQIDGKNILTDPVWSDRIGPGTPFDAPRLNKPGIAIEKLPAIDIVLISHDHYDHLDEETILVLAKNKSTLFVIPLNVKEILLKWGVQNVVELDWWDTFDYQDLKIVCTPAQHFSGRGLKRNNTLWASYVVVGKTKKFYFAGDTGYWKHLKQIGDAYGPFDLVAIPIGAYIPEKIMKFMHTNPSEAVDAYIDLKAKIFVPIHYGTFPLSDEPYDEPPKLLLEAAKKNKLNEKNFWILKLGEIKKW